MTLRTTLILTHLTCLFVGAFASHLYYQKKLGNNVKIGQSLITAIVVFFWTASMYRELFLGGTQTSPYLYAMFGIVQGVAFGMSFENIINYFRK